MTVLLINLFDFNIYRTGFNLLSFWGLALTYMYFQIPLMVLIMAPAIDGLKREWREAASNLGDVVVLVEEDDGFVNPGVSEVGDDHFEIGEGAGHFIEEVGAGVFHFCFWERCVPGRRVTGRWRWASLAMKWWPSKRQHDVAEPRSCV